MEPEAAKRLVDTLVAATLVAASLAVLFVLWQADVAEALKAPKSGGGTDNDAGSRKIVLSALLLKSLPLLLTAIATVLVLCHQIGPLIHEAWACWGKNCDLDDIKALTVINCIVVGLLALGLAGQAWNLASKYRQLGGVVWLGKLRRRMRRHT